MINRILTMVFSWRFRFPTCFTTEPAGPEVPDWFGQISAESMEGTATQKVAEKDGTFVAMSMW